MKLSFIAASILAISTLLGCQTSIVNKRGATIAESGRKEHVVMVIDTDFDTDLEIFRGKIIGEYTLLCQDDSNDSLPSRPEEVEAELRKKLSKKQFSEKCSITPGIEETPQQEESVLAIKDRWNKAMKERDFSSLSRD